MGRWVRCLTIFLFIFQAPMFALTDWTSVAEKIKQSIVRIDTKEGICTGVVIDKDRKHVLCAGHCYAEKELFIDHTPAATIYYDPRRKDLLVLKATDLDKPALKLAAHDPKVGSEVASWGFGYGLDEPLFRSANVSGHVSIPEVGGPFVMVDSAYVGGQSGGAVFNLTGEIVAIVQMSDNRSGIGVGAETIKERVGRFFTVQP